MTTVPIRGVRAAARTTAARVGLASAAAVLFAPPAFAEAGTTESPARDPGDGVTLVSGVTVTATDEASSSSDPRIGKLVDAPQTVTVIPEAVIEQRNATTLRDVLRNVPGISMQAGEGGVPNGDNLTLRGFNARTDIFVDGVRDLGGYFRDSFNLQSVEVVKGPASAQAGRGSTGGIINQVSKQPQLNRFMDANLGLGTDGYGRAVLDVNQPLEGWIEGAALRVNLMYHVQDTPGRDYVDQRRWGMAPTLVLGAATDTRFVLSWFRLEQDNTPDYGLPWVPNTAAPSLAPLYDQIVPVDFDTWYGVRRRDYEKTATNIGAARMEHDFNDDWTLTQTFRFVTVDRDSVVTAPRFNAGAETIRSELQSRDQVDQNFTSQTQLIANLGGDGYVRHGLLFGMELVRENAINFLRAQATPPPPTAWDDPDPERDPGSPVRRTGAFNEALSSTVAVYTFDTMRLGEHFELTGGLRWDSYETRYNQINAAHVQTAAFENAGSRLSGRLGALWRPIRDASVYVSYGTSFNPSAEGLTLTVATQGLPPEESETWEAGAKWDMLDGRLLVAAAVFRTDKTNARTTDPLTSIVTLTGRQRVQGFEISLSGEITEGWTVFGGYTRLDSEITRSSNPAEIGSDLPNTPENSLSLWTTYRLLDRYTFGAGAQFVDSRFANTVNTRRADSYWTFDAMASWEATEKVSVQLNVYNLADERYLDSLGGGHAVPGWGRSAVLSVGYRF